MKLQLRMAQHIVRRGWVVVMHVGGFLKEISAVYRSKRVAEREAMRRIIESPELIGMISVQRGEERLHS